ncbi:MAG TPA: IS701 family transposase, partial [Candidatus Dormibacteraeota bacterium]|nr:IS701 family transposase [Candidatus Dormibacteraeota bacterium]
MGTPRWGALLARRSLSDPDDLASSLALAPTEVSLQELATVAATRSTAEPCFKEAKGETRLDQ